MMPLNTSLRHGFGRRSAALTALTLAMVVLPASATVTERSVYTCDTLVAQQPTFVVNDEITRAGALLERPMLIRLPNGLNAVSFSVRYANRLNHTDRLFKIRYSIQWSDDCGRPISVGSSTVEGFVLNPGQVKQLESPAFHRDASRASLHLYIEK